MGRIVQLSKNIINQIAAGEVIERPYSVVKELVENSIDAGATRISIEISNECRNIRVADNGSGIHPDDIVLAFSKHATSKITCSEDLYNVKTMGFRGEALASIISISKLTCITRTKDYDYGTKVSCQNSEVTKSQTGCAIGTIMEICDLFYNLPARLKFLKTPKTEFAYIHEFIQSISLIHPEIAFELKFNGKVSLKTNSVYEQKQTIREVFNDEVVKNLKPVYKEDKLSNLVIEGFVSTPDYTRSSKKDYYTYVNSRIVKCPVFQKSIDNVYRNLIGNGRYPFIVLNLKIPPEDIDVNVHPTKKEVRYKNPNQIFNFIYSAVDEALKTSFKNFAQNVQTQKDSSQELFEQNQEQNLNQKQIFQSNKNAYANDNTIFVDADSSIKNVFQNDTNKSEKLTYNNDLKIYEPKVTNLPVKNFNTNLQSKFVHETEFKSDDIIIGQYKKTYILIEKEDGLEIVDQHIADERYIYETLKKSKNIDCQLLFISDVIDIAPSDKALLESNKDKLNKFGYEIDFLSEEKAIFRKIPQILSKISPKDIMADILENISGDLNNIEEQILITTSCKAAVKANTYLNQYQMEEIIKNWRTCENPETCPHGRPISKLLSHKEIAGFFQRNK